jgi:hypothetical protein
MDLCRRILLDLEGNDAAVGGSNIPLPYDGHNAKEVSYHIMLLHEAGLLEGVEYNQSPINWVSQRLTWSGHEFLDTSRKETFWKKAKDTAIEKTGGLSFEVLKMVLTKLASEAVSGAGS